MNAPRHHWTQDEIAYLTVLGGRHQDVFKVGRKITRRNAHDRMARLSERQYVILRFNGRHNFNSLISDQAIWAKYQRINGRLGARQAIAKVNRKAVDRLFSAEGVTVTPGMNMKNWSDLGKANIGSGATRVIYDLGDYVLKVARGSRDGRFDGTRSNKREVGVWNKVTAADEKYFAKIIAADPDGIWVVQEKVRPDAFNTTQAERVARRYGVSDLHGGNFGTRADGQVVVLDYASA